MKQHICVIMFHKVTYSAGETRPWSSQPFPGRLTAYFVYSRAAGQVFEGYMKWDVNNVAIIVV
jgi:hypothetical protein